VILPFAIDTNTSSLVLGMDDPFAVIAGERDNRRDDIREVCTSTWASRNFFVILCVLRGGAAAGAMLI
jgi:hypothetical protein